MPLRDQRPPYVITARVVKTFGVQGWVKLEILSTNPLRFRKGHSFILEDDEEGERLYLESARHSGKGLLVKFRGFDDRERAALLKGKMLMVTREELGEPPEGYFWEHQILGLKVYMRQGKYLGEVTEIMETGANDVLLVEGEREYLIPMTEEVVAEVSPEEGIMKINPLPGLLEA